MEELEELREELQEVRAAIKAIVTGAQEYQIGNRRLSRTDLSTLYAQRARLKAEIARQENGATFFAELGRL